MTCCKQTSMAHCTVPNPTLSDQCILRDNLQWFCLQLWLGSCIGSCLQVRSSHKFHDFFRNFSTKFFSPSVTISIGMPYLQNHFSKIASAIVLASLLSIATSSTYFVNVSVMHKIYFFPLPDTTKNPNRSALILWLGWVHCGNGDSRAGLV